MGLLSKIYYFLFQIKNVIEIIVYPYDFFIKATKYGKTKFDINRNLKKEMKHKNSAIF